MCLCGNGKTILNTESLHTALCAYMIRYSKVAPSQLGKPHSYTLIGFISQQLRRYVHQLCRIQIKAHHVAAGASTSLFHLFLLLSWTVLGVCEPLNKDL